MLGFYQQAVKSVNNTCSGNFFRLGVTDFRPWSDKEIEIGTVNGVEYVNTREAKSGDNRSYFTDSVSSCCALAARRVMLGDPLEQGALKRILGVRTFLAHVVDSYDADVVAAELSKFQCNFNEKIQFYMFTMQAHLERGIIYGETGVGFSGAYLALIKAYGKQYLPHIAKQTTIITGYQGIFWNNINCGVYVRPHGIFPVTSQVGSYLFSDTEGWI